jgi:hypothetical protein
MRWRLGTHCFPNKLVPWVIFLTRAHVLADEMSARNASATAPLNGNRCGSESHLCCKSLKRTVLRCWAVPECRPTFHQSQHLPMATMKAEFTKHNDDPVALLEWWADSFRGDIFAIHNDMLARLAGCSFKNIPWVVETGMLKRLDCAAQSLMSVITASTDRKADVYRQALAKLANQNVLEASTLLSGWPDNLKSRLILRLATRLSRRSDEWASKAARGRCPRPTGGSSRTAVPRRLK